MFVFEEECCEILDRVWWPEKSFIRTHYHFVPIENKKGSPIEKVR